MSHIEDSPAVSFPLEGRFRAESSRKDTQENTGKSEELPVRQKKAWEAWFRQEDGQAAGKC